MMIQWNERTFRWFLAAADYTGYYEKMAALLLEHIDARGTLCDLGCGMGLVDFELAPRVGSIDCFDRDAAAADFVNRRAAELGIKNVRGQQADARELEGRWDTVISLFCGTAEDWAGKFLSLAGDRMVVVTHDAAAGFIAPEGYRMRKCNLADDTAAYLDSRGLSYQRFPGQIEFGQPLRDMDDARAFVTSYSTGAPAETVEESLARRLTTTGRTDYPLYLPSIKAFSIFVLEGKA